MFGLWKIGSSGIYLQKMISSFSLILSVVFGSVESTNRPPADHLYALSITAS